MYVLDVADVLMALNINIDFEHYRTKFLFLTSYIYLKHKQAQSHDFVLLIKITIEAIVQPQVISKLN